MCVCVCVHARVCVSVRGEAGREGGLEFSEMGWGGGGVGGGGGFVLEMGGFNPLG